MPEIDTAAPPDLDLLASVEQDMGRVEQSLRELDDVSADPAEVLAWLPEMPAADSDQSDVTSEDEPVVEIVEAVHEGDAVS